MRSPAICTAVNSTCTMKPSPAPIATSVSAETMRNPGVIAGRFAVTLCSRATERASASAPFTGAGMPRELKGGASITNPAARQVASSSPARVTAGTERSTADQVRPSSVGSMWNSDWVKLTISESTQLPDTSSAIATAIILGTKDSVCSWIWVAAWNSEIRNPTSSAVSRMGAATLAASSIVCSARSVTWESVIAALPRSVRMDQCGGDQRPPVDDDEQQQLERQRHDRRRDHHHAHRHECRADQHVEHQEGDEDDQPDDERALELGEDERRDQRGHADLVLVLGRLLSGQVDHQLELVLAGVLQEEPLEGDNAGVVGLGDRHLTVEVRLHRDVVDVGEHRPHHEHREEQR